MRYFFELTFVFSPESVGWGEVVDPSEILELINGSLGWRDA